MIAKRVVKFNIKKNHIDYNYIKQQLIESKEIYNYANYVIRQIFFKKSRNNKYNMDFVDEYPELKDLFLNYKIFHISINLQNQKRDFEISLFFYR